MRILLTYHHSQSRTQMTGVQLTFHDGLPSRWAVSTVGHTRQGCNSTFPPCKFPTGPSPPQPPGVQLIFPDKRISRWAASQFPVTYIPNPKPKKRGFPQPSSSQHCCLASSLLHIPAWSSCASPGFLSPTGPWSRPPLVFGGQFLCGVARSAPAGKHDSQVRLPARVLPVWALLGSSVGRHSLSPTGLRESQQPTS
jgi:hypothetical protein